MCIYIFWKSAEPVKKVRTNRKHMFSVKIDFQCVLGADSKYLIKQMSTIAIDTLMVKNWIFKQQSDHKYLVDVKWNVVNYKLQRNYHQLSMACGGVKYWRDFLEGGNRDSLIYKYVPSFSTVNLEVCGCSGLNQLSYGVLLWYVCHKDLNPKRVSSIGSSRSGDGLPTVSSL